MVGLCSAYFGLPLLLTYPKSKQALLSVVFASFVVWDCVSCAPLSLSPLNGFFAAAFG